MNYSGKRLLISPEAGRQVLGLLLRQRDILGALQVMHQELGDVFRIPLPGFNPVVLVGPEANHFVLVTSRHDLRWRNERDPVTRLLRHGLLVEDGEVHDRLRRIMSQALHKRVLLDYVAAIQRRTDQVIATWGQQGEYNMLVEMRRIALLILMDTLFGVDFSLDISRLWSAILQTIEFISPGLWILWPEMPRPGYARAIHRLDEYLYRIITERRNASEKRADLLGVLVDTPELSDELVRDQLLTILIAGHDTSTALLAWALYLLGKNPEAMHKVQAEVDQVLGDAEPELAIVDQLIYLSQVLDETARMYPPIHVGNRTAAIDLEFQGFPIPAGTRIMYSIYLTHRHPAYWTAPDQFHPERFSPGRKTYPPYAYIPFGGGQRNCIGMAFAQVEVKTVLARLLQRYKFTLLADSVHAHMGATLEPRPGVKMRVQRRG